MGYRGCRVMIAGERRADTPSTENFVGREICGREGESPGVKLAGCCVGRSMGGRGGSSLSTGTVNELTSQGCTFDGSWWGIVLDL